MQVQWTPQLRVYYIALLFILNSLTRGFENNHIASSNTACFKRTGIRREIQWESASTPVPHQNEIRLLKSGVLMRRGEFCDIHDVRLDEVEQECKSLGITLRQGLLIRRQLMVSKVVSSSWKLKEKEKLNLMVQNFETHRKSLMELTKDMDLPPVSILRAILAERVCKAYPEMLERDRKRIVKSIIGERDPEKVEQFLSKWELAELQKAKEFDVVGYSEEKQTPAMWEQALYSFLDEHGINYVSEETLREAEMKTTPDCLILDDFFIDGVQLRWIDVKSFYGSGLRENRHFTNSLKKQIQKYEATYVESGAVIFKHGFSRKLRDGNPSTLFLDGGPLLSEINLKEKTILL